MEESAIISRLSEIFAARSGADLIVGIGDDAALFRTKGNLVAVSTDILTEGTHFKREWSDLYSIGRKAAAANLADILAMGAVPTYLLVAVAFDPKEGEGIFDLAHGIADECGKVGVRVIGGDLSRSQVLTVAITALGESRADEESIITRAGAREGDGLYIVDLPGKSYLGLEQLIRGIVIDADAIAFHKAPSVAYQHFFKVADCASALCDISDGILMDASTLARASGVRIDIDSEALAAHPDFASIASIAEEMGLDPLEAILSSGEEHSPLFTALPERVATLLAGVRSYRIGTVVGRRDSEGSVAVTVDGKKREDHGFKHF